VRRVIERLPPALASQLAGTEIAVEPLPSERQVRDEIDPRQVVMAEGIDPERGAFERMWIFFDNFLRGGITPTSAEEDLLFLFERELAFGADDDAGEGDEPQGG
jgi:hypothetical protein